MNMDFSMIQQQSMKLVMTNELRQAITMLQYSVQDLHDYLQEQQLENPLIELDVSKAEKDFHRPVSSDDAGISALDFVAAGEEGLQDHLLSQLREQQLDAKEYAVASYLALNVDENGYLAGNAAQFAEELNEPEELIAACLRLLQSLEPAGVGAGSLRECLLLQLERMPVRDRLAEAVVDRHLDRLASRQFKQIAKDENVTAADVQSAADFIVTLNPKPGAAFYQEPAEYITPDATVTLKDGEWLVQLNNDALPVMRINRSYEQLYRQDEQEVQSYLKQKQEQFLWIQRSIAQRQDTILRVTKAVVEHQRAFLEHGPEHLKPLTLKTVAEKLDIHESTVSRAATKKYVQTPRGLYELKFFFKSGVVTESGADQSADRAKIYLKKMIDGENKRKPLSDQKLSQLLADEHGIELKRRTVAKYREEMHVPSSSKRKRYES